MGAGATRGATRDADADADADAVPAGRSLRLFGPYTKVNRCLAEGRKSFLERYAGIESGRECERLAPALSAFVDGEGDPAQVVDLRTHLRQCLACRAAVRGLHDASRPLSVVFPVGGLIVAAGGSVAVQGVLSAAPVTPQALVRRADNGLATTFVKSPTPNAKTHMHVKPRSHGRASEPRDHRRIATSAAATSQPAAKAASAAASPPAATTPQASAASASSPRRSAGSASSEFGFEGP